VHRCSGTGGAAWPVVKSSIVVETAADSVFKIALRGATGTATAVGRVVSRNTPFYGSTGPVGGSLGLGGKIVKVFSFVSSSCRCYRTFNGLMTVNSDGR
jgi:hypothetical protein